MTNELNEEGIPIIPPKRQVAPDGTVAICGVCGLRLKQIMGYVCQKSNCPVFPKIT